MFDIIADSACDFTPEMAQKMGVEIVPFYVSLDGEHYRKEGKEIAVRDFYQFMVDNPSAYPKTSLASIEDYETAFRAHAAAGRDVLCLVFTGKMSGCVGSARNARELVLEDYPDARIEVMDSTAATVTEAVMVENAVAMRDAGCSLDETVTWLEAEKVTNQIFFTVGNLDYLIKGGRIGKVTGRAANMLGIKPMILFKDGEIFSGGVARGRQKSFEKALEQLMNYLAAHGGTPDDYRITVGYGYDADEGKRLWMQTRAALRAKYPGAQCEVGLLQIGCTIAVHTGPYALGMGVMRRWKKAGLTTALPLPEPHKKERYHADFQHPDPPEGRVCAAGAGRVPHLRLRPDGLQLHPHRQRPPADRVRYPAPLSGVPRQQGDLRFQHHRH